MKKIFTFLSVVALTATMSAQTNLLQNPGFENGLAPWAAGTVNTYTDPSILTDAHSGNASAGYSPATAITGFYQNVPVTGGNTYVISFWYKASSGSAARLWSVFKNTGGTAVYTTKDATTDEFRTLNKYLAAASVWTQATMEMPADATATSLDVALRVYTNQTASFDDIMAYDKANLSTVDFSKSKFSLVKNTVVKNEISFAKKSNIQIINMAGQVVKTAAVNDGTTLDVSSLAKGVYIVTGDVNGEKVSQKINKQ